MLAEIDWLLHALADTGDISRFAAERDRLADFMLEAHATEQPLHGDASLSNLLATGGGPRWNDFEDVCVGAVEWDVAGVLSDARARHGESFSAELLAAYGGGLDRALIAQVDQVHALYGALWRRYVGR